MCWIKNMNTKKKKNWDKCLFHHLSWVLNVPLFLHSLFLGTSLFGKIVWPVSMGSAFSCFSCGGWCYFFHVLMLVEPDCLVVFKPCNNYLACPPCGNMQFILFMPEERVDWALLNLQLCFEPNIIFEQRTKLQAIIRRAKQLLVCLIYVFTSALLFRTILTECHQWSLVDPLLKSNG